MNKDDSAKVFSVWSNENSINQPNKKELLLDIVDQVASLFATGSFYYYVFNFDLLKMEYVHNNIKNVLGIEPDEFSIKKLFKIMHPEDLSKMDEKETFAFQFFFNNLSIENYFLYKVVYIMRLKHTDGTYKNILHQASVFNISDDGKVQQVLCVHTDITFLNIPINHNISFISSKKQSYHYSKNENGYSILDEKSFRLNNVSLKTILTKREKEVVEFLAKGKTCKEIAKLIFLSPHTINTHKKNILCKSECKSTPELIAKYYINGLL